jgi:hypothetical protein
LFGFPAQDASPLDLEAPRHTVHRLDSVESRASGTGELDSKNPPGLVFRDLTRYPKWLAGEWRYSFANFLALLRTWTTGSLAGVTVCVNCRALEDFGNRRFGLK